MRSTSTHSKPVRFVPIWTRMYTRYTNTSSMLKVVLSVFKFRPIYNVSNIKRPNNGQFFSAFAPHIHKVKESTTNYQKSQTLDDGDYFVRVQHNPEIFGTEPPDIETPDRGDIAEEQDSLNVKQVGKKLSTKQYADMIKSLLQKKKIKEAIDVVEIRMLKEDKVQPENYLYNLLLGACGRVGYTKKAFQLFNDMKKRGLAVHPGAYTALFNACANSPWAEDGLTRAKQLHNLMIEKMYEPNDSNYNAMIKAYGRCGDINAAFALVDEMIQKKFVIKDDTLNFLLQACISDKEAGFRHALLVWHKFLKKRIIPSVYSYNLLLRATRDCGLGDFESTKDVLKRILPKTDKFLQISDGVQNNTTESAIHPPLEENELIHLQTEEIAGGILEVDNTHNASDLNRPNLLVENPRLGDIVLISEISKAEDRLLLLGGATNFLDDMHSKECAPDIKTSTLILDCLPNSAIAERDLLASMKKHSVKLDLDFYNMLIKKRSMRFDYDGAKDVLKMLHKENFQPDLISYGLLALGCRNKEEAENFLLEMEASKYRLNAEILGAMLQQSTYHFDFSYVLFVMDRCVQEHIQPNSIFMDRLTKFYNRCKTLSNDSSNSFGKSKKFSKGFQIFRMRLKTWKTQVTPEEDMHPWQQYRQPVYTDVRHFKDKERTSHFKPRHLSKFREPQKPAEVLKKSKKSTSRQVWKPKTSSAQHDKT